MKIQYTLDYADLFLFYFIHKKFVCANSSGLSGSPLDTCQISLSGSPNFLDMKGSSCTCSKFFTLFWSILGIYYFRKVHFTSV